MKRRPHASLLAASFVILSGCQMIAGLRERSEDLDDMGSAGVSGIGTAGSSGSGGATSGASLGGSGGSKGLGGGPGGKGGSAGTVGASGSSGRDAGGTAGGFTGGFAGFGGAAGFGGSGGVSGGSGPGPIIPCPESLPLMGPCTAPQQICLYAEGSARCDDDYQWHHVSCPATQPNDGQSCNLGSGGMAGVGGSMAGAAGAAASGGAGGAGGSGWTPSPHWGLIPLLCEYEAVSCSCNGTWQCDFCPLSQPANNSACGSQYNYCDYDDTRCTCNGMTWSCASGSCPASPSGIQGHCGGYSTPLVACAYDGASCACSHQGTNSMQFWYCTCPTSKPAEGSACPRSAFYGLPPCVFDDEECTCSPNNTWQCSAGCPATQPEDGGECELGLTCEYGGGAVTCGCPSEEWICQ